MDFNAFKLKSKGAGFKVGLLSKSSYQIISDMIQDTEQIVLGFEAYPEKITGTIGAAVITNENFYAQLPKADKTFQSLVISRAAIKGIVFPEKGVKVFKLDTSEGIVDIGQILEPKIYPALKQLFNAGEKADNTIRITTPKPAQNFAKEEISETDYEPENDSTSKEVEEYNAWVNQIENTERKLRCPKCKSDNIEPMPITSGKTKGFGLGKAVVGGAILGPVGLAAGVIGMGKGKTKTDIMWICKSCGKQFDKPKKA